MLLSHYHEPARTQPNEDIRSPETTPRTPPFDKKMSARIPIFSTKVSGLHLAGDIVDKMQDIAALREQASRVIISTEIKRYLQNIAVFLRMHRAIASGVTPQATKDFELLARCLAPLHGLDFVSPSLVALAAPKVYNHRLVLTAPEDEWSLQYGSDPGAVALYLKDLSPKLIIRDVLDTVEVPV